MYKPRPCGCKGVRTCLICEEQYGIQQRHPDPTNTCYSNGNGTGNSTTATDKANVKEPVYEYCYLCELAWKGSNVVDAHPYHCQEESIGTLSLSSQPGSSPDSVSFPGVLLIPNFLTEAEETRLIEGCDSIPWDLSQSGRRKQNFGPKTNFNKKKINGSSFNGFPEFGQFIQDKFRDTAFLSDFQTIEQCAIEYRTETGAHIDPHIDDCWVWGERVISVNLISDSILTMNRFKRGNNLKKYNLEDFYVSRLCNESNQKGISSMPEINDYNQDNLQEHETNFIVRIPMPRRSLLVLHGPARYEWEHSVLRKDITSRRICLAYREFTKEYLENGKYHEAVGLNIINKAKLFW